ncbi:hypothetical protein [Alicycliphilus denitrificans]|uniref:hypothetical protein n=1 Tax=Alicycliphilus denitrificans TaxID=179636 RepID=UPI000C9EE8E6|nr:hypothetical protein [Alicycliphilus denitrificans]
MTTPAVLSIVLYQGTTQRVPLVRRYVPYKIKGSECDGYVNACTGEPVPPGDFVDEDYAGCMARMQLRSDVFSTKVLLELTTEGGGIELAGNTLTLVFQPEDTQGLRFDEAVGHVEVVRSNGDVERQYEITVQFSPEGTR